MTKHTHPLTRTAAALAVCGLASLWPAAWRPGPLAVDAVEAQPQQQRTEVDLVITGDSGTPPRYAVPDFVALTPDAAEAARTLGQVLWDDLNFEREFYLIPRDTYATIPPARSAEQVPFSSWQELGADAVFFGSVQRTGDTVRVQVRLLNVKTRQSVFAKEYSGTASNPRVYAHTIADEIHQQQRALRGVARTKLAFASDRTRDRVVGAVPNRDVKEIYIADYDGGNQQRITNTRKLNIMPAWSPDARAVAYTSYRRIEPDIYISRIYQGILENPLKGGGANYLGVFSPDGARLAFMSNRDGNPEIYAANRDGSGVRRLTSHPAGDSTPTWSPNGAQIAFTSDRSGQPQIYIMSSSDGTGLRRLATTDAYAEQATWSASLNEIAFAGGTSSHTEIKVLELSTGNVRQITSGAGSSERPTFAPNGRHLAFTTSRNGRTHVFTIARDGKDARQVTTEGNNFSPAWSQ